MDEKHRDNGDRIAEREASTLRKEDQRDDVSRRREQPDDHQPLTRRERQERWPIG
jgi:hypothetical protein